MVIVNIFVVYHLCVSGSASRVLPKSMMVLFETHHYKKKTKNYSSISYLLSFFKPRINMKTLVRKRGLIYVFVVILSF